MIHNIPSCDAAVLPRAAESNRTGIFSAAVAHCHIVCCMCAATEKEQNQTAGWERVYWFKKLPSM